MTADVRPARPDDYPDFARLFPELGVDDPVPPESRWRELIAPQALILAEPDGRVAGYAYFEILRDTGYVRHLVVAPDRRGRGYGRALMTATARHLREAGCAGWRLNVRPENEPAVALYRRLGMERAYDSAALRFPWSLVARLPAPAIVPAETVPGPEDDPGLEQAFDLPTGQLAAARSQHHRLVRALRDRDSAQWRGLAVFDPRFPGAFPFRVREVEDARPLLETLRCHARPELPHMQVVVEAHEALTRRLLDAGATLRLRLAHFRGALPR